MTSKEAMEVGRQIAEQHRNNVLEIARLNGDPQEAIARTSIALRGCEVDLAAQIMVAFGKISDGT